MTLPAVPRLNKVLTAAGLIADEWDSRFLVPVLAYLAACPVSRTHVALTAQAASISATAIIPASATTGAVYRVSHAFRVTQAATVSSSFTLALAWTSGGVAQTETYAAVTGNTTTTRQVGTYLVKADSGTAITYAVTYASVGVDAMQYELDVMLEQMP